MIRAVIDTNVLVSALIKPTGSEALAMLAIQQGWITPCFSSEILEEYASVLARPKFGFSVEEIAALIELMRARDESIELHGSSQERFSPDPDDEMFVACALAAEAEFIVTGNKRHFPLAGMESQ